MDRLNSKDMLTAENVMTKVHEHNDTILFPRLRNRFGDANVPAEDNREEEEESTDVSESVEVTAGDGTANLDNTHDSAPNDEQQKEGQEQEDGVSEQEQHASARSGLASTLPAPVSSSSSKPRPNTTAGRLSKTAGAPKPPLALKSCLNPRSMKLWA